LEAMSGSSITFLGRVSDDVVDRYISRCRALIFPGEEDFGMAPLEVAAAGRPTIAYRGGGALETIIENVTGLFFNHQTPDDLGDCIERFEKLDWCRAALRKHSESFNIRVFRERFRSFLRRIGISVSAIESKPNPNRLIAAFPQSEVSQLTAERFLQGV
jgi:glycosyltransferase involved in cell wall biosynthesis